MGSFIESVTELSCHLTYTLKTATLKGSIVVQKGVKKIFLLIVQ